MPLARTPRQCTQRCARDRVIEPGFQKLAGFARLSEPTFIRVSTRDELCQSTEAKHCPLGRVKGEQQQHLRRTLGWGWAGGGVPGTGLRTGTMPLATMACAASGLTPAPLHGLSSRGRRAMGGARPRKRGDVACALGFKRGGSGVGAGGGVSARVGRGGALGVQAVVDAGSATAAPGAGAGQGGRTMTTTC